MNQFLGENIVKVVFDSAATDTSDAANITVTAHPLGVYIPDNAIVIDAFYDVITTFTSAGDTATIALKVNGANDLVTAIAINDATNPWDGGVHVTLAGSPAIGSNATSLDSGTNILYAGTIAESQIKLTAAREVTATVGTQALATGKLNLYIIYILSE